MPDFPEEWSDVVSTEEEDNTSLMKLIRELTVDNFRDELDLETLMTSLDVIYEFPGVDITLHYGSSIIINLKEEYFERTPIKTDLSEAIFLALNHFSHWYLKHKNNGKS